MRALLPLILTLVACDDLPGVDLQRMKEQSHRRDYAPSELFSDGRAMRSPLLGTVAREQQLGSRELLEGVTGANVEVNAVPFAIDAARLLRGKDRYEVYCATCHGLRGDGDTTIAANMELRRPPSFLTAEMRRYPSGHLYRAASFGFGLMPSYAEELTSDDRWAVVAYIRALQRAADTSLQSLTPELQARARAALPRGDTP